MFGGGVDVLRVDVLLWTVAVDSDSGQPVVVNGWIDGCLVVNRNRGQMSEWTVVVVDW